MRAGRIGPHAGKTFASDALRSASGRSPRRHGSAHARSGPHDRQLMRLSASEYSDLPDPRSSLRMHMSCSPCAVDLLAVKARSRRQAGLAEPLHSCFAGPNRYLRPGRREQWSGSDGGPAGAVARDRWPRVRDNPIHLSGHDSEVLIQETHPLAVKFVTSHNRISFPWGLR